MSKQWLLFAVGGTVGVCAGITFSSGVKNSQAANLAIAGLSGISCAFVAYNVADSLAAKERQDIESKLAREIEAERNKSAERQSGLTRELRLAKDGFVSLQQELVQTQSVIDALKRSLDLAKQQSKISAKKADELAEEIAEWEAQFQSRVAAEAEKQFKAARRGEIEKIFIEHDGITSEAIEIASLYQRWATKLADRHDSKRAIVTSLAANYNNNLSELGTAVERERLEYVSQIELLNVRIAELQQQKAGNLTEPIYGDFGFDRNGQIANELARILFSELGLPLRVEGVRVLPNAAIEVGYSYSRNIAAEAIIEAIERQKEPLCRRLGIFRIIGIRKLEIAWAVAVSFRIEPAVKDSEIKLMLGSPEEFLAYVTSRPIRYRIIADPGVGKTPTTAVMVSEILKSGTRRGNTSKGAKNPHTLVTVSYPGVASSLKDTDYPLAPFLKYGDTTAANKSFGDAIADWDFRKKCPTFAAEFFHLWIWDELDNTLLSASDPQDSADNLKTILKQGGHSNIGWIVSGQSVMIKDLKGFTIDDRSLFTEMVVGIPKIRKYLQIYGKGRNSEDNLKKLLINLDQIEEWVEAQNEKVTDDARLLRVALIVDERSPKLYLLPNLDSANFDWDTIEETRRLADEAKRSIAEGKGMTPSASKVQNPYPGSADRLTASSSNLPIPGVGQTDQKPHCPHCGSDNLKMMGDKRYSCKDCKKRFVETKAVWR